MDDRTPPTREAIEKSIAYMNSVKPTPPPPQGYVGTIGGIKIFPSRNVKKRNRAIMVGRGEIHLHPKVYKRLCRTKNLEAILSKIKVVQKIFKPTLGWDYLGLGRAMMWTPRMNGRYNG